LLRRDAGSRSWRPSSRISRKVNEIFLAQNLAQKPLPGDRLSDQAGNRRRSRLPHATRLRSSFYAWKGRPASAQALRHLWLASEITDVHRESGGIYRERRVAAELGQGRGIVVNRKTVTLLMRPLDLYGLPKKRLRRSASSPPLTSSGESLRSPLRSRASKSETSTQIAIRLISTAIQTFPADL
jgi:hypothetical protein